MENNQLYLYHHGVKGMKWGVRRSRAQLARAGGRKSKEAHEDYTNVHSKKSIQSMSNAELKARNNRLQMERQYKDLTKKTNTGKKIVDTFIATAGTIAAVTTAYNTYSKLAGKSVDKIGDKIVKSINLSGHLTS